MENLTGGTPPVRPLPCVVPCKLYFTVILTVGREFYICMDGANLFLHRSAQSFQFLLPFCFQLLCGLLMYFFGFWLLRSLF